MYKRQGDDDQHGLSEQSTLKMGIQGDGVSDVAVELEGPMERSTMAGMVSLPPPVRDYLTLAVCNAVLGPALGNYV